MRNALVLLIGVACLSACNDGDNVEKAPEQPKSRAVVTSSISKDPDPEKRKSFNQEMVDSMYEDDAVPAELIPGEAFRRGVEVDQERLDKKIAREKQRGAS